MQRREVPLQLEKRHPVKQLTVEPLLLHEAVNAQYRSRP